MASATRIRNILLRTPVLLAAVAIMVAAIAVVVAMQSPAFAQEQGWSLRDLFFPRRAERVYPPAPQLQRPKPRKKVRAAPAQPAEPQIQAVEKAPDARTVLVVGDFMASGLAEGLQELFADNAGIRVVDKSKGSSGFVRDDFYNWSKEIGPLLESEKPAAVLVMLGSNDRQQMKVGNEREPPRSDVWTMAYEARTKDLGKAISAAKVPFLWVGMPAFKLSRMSADMLAFNDIYKAAAEASGGEFVDIWEGFVDESGAFVSTGPDVSGQPVRLRADDGINLTRAGKRKVAFYAEKPLLKLLGLASPTGVPAAPAPASPKVAKPEGTPPALADRTQPMLLDDPALDGASELLGAAPRPKSEPVSPAEKLVVEGVASKPSPGRADEFSARPQPAAPATGKSGTAAGSGPDTTTAIRR
ncbi:DUF459 domain-containing protein [Mesorhizobium sp. SP-1A]|uniref:SGNH/GDSL hydrolase family protein n=1 Tax=Mesorhizobium sp. SP-1A TaxID=3077840 RepID=UPI0028F6FD32|nr:DUF459 domain-containing protein [Mesorhizobium sp. SP-1A]